MIVADALMFIVGCHPWTRLLETRGWIIEHDGDVLHFKERGMIVTLSDCVDHPHVSCNDVVLENTLQVPPHS